MMSSKDLNIEFKRERQLSEADLNAVYQLWNQEYPKSIAYNKRVELIHYLDLLRDLNHVLMLKEEKIIGWYWEFMRDGERNFAMMLDRNFHGFGIGSACLNLAKSRHEKLSGWVVDQNDFKRADESEYLSPLGFYMKNDFEVLADQRFESEKLSTVRIVWKKGENELIK